MKRPFWWSSKCWKGFLTVPFCEKWLSMAPYSIKWLLTPILKKVPFWTTVQCLQSQYVCLRLKRRERARIRPTMVTLYNSLHKGKALIRLFIWQDSSTGGVKKYHEKYINISKFWPTTIATSTFSPDTKNATKNQTQIENQTNTQQKNVLAYIPECIC